MDDSVNWSHVFCVVISNHTIYFFNTYSLSSVCRRHFAADLEIRREMHCLHNGDKRLEFVVLHDVRRLAMERFEDALPIVDGDMAQHVLGAEGMGGGGLVVWVIIFV